MCSTISISIFISSAQGIYLSPDFDRNILVIAILILVLDFDRNILVLVFVFTILVLVVYHPWCGSDDALLHQPIEVEFPIAVKLLAWHLFDEPLGQAHQNVIL